MPADALTYEFLSRELDKKLSGGKISKITMPGKECIVLTVRSQGQNNLLLVSANPSDARMHLIPKAPESPATPPSFLMHLRKHIGGGIIEKIFISPFERIVNIRIRAYNELSVPETKILAAEIMGKYSNIILINENGKISDCIRHIAADTSSKRLVMPGLEYMPPPPQSDKASPAEAEKIRLSLLSYDGTDMAKYLMRYVYGLAPVSYREVLARAGFDRLEQNLNQEIIEKILKEFAGLYDASRSNPCLLVCGGQFKDFFAYPYLSEGRETDSEFVFYPELSMAMERYYSEEKSGPAASGGSDRIMTVIRAGIKKNEKKLGEYRQKIHECEDFDTDKTLGDLITANIYRIKKGVSEIELENYYDENKPVRIKIDGTKTPQANAQAYYKKYSKKKKTIDSLTTFSEKLEANISLLKALEIDLAFCKDPADFEDIMSELTALGLYKRLPQGRRKDAQKRFSSPIKISYDGYDIYIGKNNIQNERLTKNARADSIWLHTKDIHGSHVIIESSKAQPPPDTVLERAAEYAAYYSAAKNSEKTPVDYTYVKYVHKPSGAAHGQVVYTNQRTVYVSPRKAEE